MSTTSIAAAVYNATRAAGRAARVRVGNHMSVARRHAVLDAYTTRVNGTLITVASYLAGLGASRVFVDRYSAAFGIKVSKAYQAKFGHKPFRTALAARGMRLFGVFAYTADERQILDQVAGDYDKTRYLLAA